MGLKSKIEWTHATWNVFTGCTPVSLGCANCYAKRLSERLKHIHPKYKNGFQFTIHRDELSKPLQWVYPKMIFVNSMSDTFHENAHDEIIIDIFEIMGKADKHIFQVLTKRSERLLEFYNKYPHLFKPHIWIGVTVEHWQYKYRIDHLRKIEGPEVRFISAEPLLSSLLEPDGKLDLTNIQWIIVGAESGRKARPMDEEWVRKIRDVAKKFGTAFFYKQKIVNGKKISLPELDGKKYEEYPDVPTFRGLLEKINFIIKR